MPTSVLDLDAAQLPDSITLPAGHTAALALLRWRGDPIGRIWMPAPTGVLTQPMLHDAVRLVGLRKIAEREVSDYLEWMDLPALATPASIRATVAICTRDRVDDLERCLSSMDGLRGEECEVLVIDSASRDGEAVRAVVERHVNARYVREPMPGLNIARNRAMRESREEVVAFCDDDAVVDRYWLRALVRNFADVRTLCVTGLTMPLELESEAQEWFEMTNSFARGFHRRVHDDSTLNPFAASRVGAGVNMALRRSVIDLIGPFDPALDAGTQTRSGGDHDMFTRILLDGYRIVYDPAALSWHRHRREWKELRDAVNGYGTGVWAYLTRHALRGEIAAPMIALRWLRSQLGGLAKALLFRPPDIRLDLSIAELRGCFAGPRAFLRSRRAVRRSAGETSG